MLKLAQYEPEIFGLDGYSTRTPTNLNQAAPMLFAALIRMIACHCAGLDEPCGCGACCEARKAIELAVASNEDQATKTLIMSAKEQQIVLSALNGLWDSIDTFDDHCGDVHLRDIDSIRIRWALHNGNDLHNRTPVCTTERRDGSLLL